MPLSTFTFTDDASGRPWAVRIVRKGDRYGRNLTNDGGTLIEFWDRKNAGRKSSWGQEFPAEGQFVARYYASTLDGHRGALCLDGGEPAWQVGSDAMARVLAWVDAQLGGAT